MMSNPARARRAGSSARDIEDPHSSTQPSWRLPAGQADGSTEKSLSSYRNVPVGADAPVTCARPRHY